MHLIDSRPWPIVSRFLERQDEFGLMMTLVLPHRSFGVDVDL